MTRARVTPFVGYSSSQERDSFGGVPLLLARHGYSYRQILAHYYPQTHIGIAQPRPVRVLQIRSHDCTAMPGRTAISISNRK